MTPGTRKALCAIAAVLGFCSSGPLAAFATTNDEDEAANTDEAAAHECVLSMSDYDDWQQIEATEHIEKMEMLIHRCTMGINGNDGQYAVRAVQAQSLHLLWGSYHFCRYEAPNGNGTYSEDPVKQADHYISTLQKLHASSSAPKRVLLILDWLSYGKNGRKFMSAKALADLIAVIKRRTGAQVGICTTPTDLARGREAPGVTPDVLDTIQQCWLWIVKHGNSLPSSDEIQPWKDWMLWLSYNGDVGAKDQSSHVRKGDFSRTRVSRGDALTRWYWANSWDFQMKN